jgi:ribosomal protein S18 acetylase RimI-like enzyme
MEIQNQFEKLLKELKTQEFESLSFTYLPKFEYVELEIIIVKKKFRRQGVASEAISRLCELCDKTKTKAVLYPSDEFGVSKKILINFYRKFGFKFYFETDYTDRVVNFMKRYPSDCEVDLIEFENLKFI